MDKRTIISYALSGNRADALCVIPINQMQLKVVKIRGVESQGMILMAESEEGNLSFMCPEKDFEAGSGIH